MKVWTCNDHPGHWVGVASIIVAETELHAYELLRAALIEQGLRAAVEHAEKINNMPTLVLLDTDKVQVIVLQNGDY